MPIVSDVRSHFWRAVQPSHVLQIYLKDPIGVFGCCRVNMDYKGQTAEMPLVIVAGSGPTRC